MAAWMYKTYHPEVFQGHTSKQKYFEGYYYKLVSADQQHAIAVIPGIAIYDDADRHAFIQLIDGVGQVTSYHRFPLDQFSADDRVLKFQIGSNHFSKSKITLDIPELQGDIQITNPIPLVSSLFNPGIMG